MSEINLNCGIYQIRNVITGYCLVGQSTRLKKRPGEHWRKLKNNEHNNYHLQNSYNKHGKECFVFEILIYCHKKYLTYYEQFFVDKYVDLNISYNICRECVDNCKGIKRSNKTRSRMSKASKNRPPITEETRKNMSIAAKNKPPMSEETCKKISEANKKRTHSEETKNKMSDARKGEKNPNYGKRGKDMPMWGKHHSEKTKNNISKSKKGQIPWNKGKTGVYSKETRKRMSESHVNQSGINNPHILKKEMVLGVLELLNNGMSVTEILKKIDVCRSTVYRVKNGFYNNIYNLKD